MSSTALGKLRQRDIRAFLAWGMLLAYSLQAFIPVGYMPDMAALQKGLIRITICSSYGRDTILVDQTGQPGKKSEAPAQHDKVFDNVCPFSHAPQADAPPLATHIFAAGFVLAEKIAALQETLFDRQIRLPAQPRAPPDL